MRQTPSISSRTFSPRRAIGTRHAFGLAALLALPTLAGCGGGGGGGSQGGGSQPTTVNGSLAPGDQEIGPGTYADIYAFVAPGPGYYTILMHSSDFAPAIYVGVPSPGGIETTASQTSTTGPADINVAVIASANQQYYAQVTSNGRGSGAYTLTFSSGLGGVHEVHNIIVNARPKAGR